MNGDEYILVEYVVFRIKLIKRVYSNGGDFI